MKSSRQVKRIVGRAHLRADQVTDERILSDAGAALAQTTDNRPQALPPGPTLWRTIMESKATKYSVAATLLVAASLILTNPFSLSGGRHGVVLAETVERMNEVRTLMHKEKRVYYEMGRDEPLLKADVVKYLSFERGIVEEQYNEDGSLKYRVYILRDPQQIILVFAEEKKYLKLPLADAWARLMENLTPKAIVEHFKAGNCRDLGPARIDGHDVEGFETSSPETFPIPEPYRFLFPIKDIKWRFWIDKDLPLPVAADLEVTTGRGLFTAFKELRITCHDYDMQYDPNLSPTIFDPNIPADYQCLNLQSVAQENAAWLGVGALPAMGFVAYRRRHPRRRWASGIQNE
jgi:hypothetical protein